MTATPDLLARRMSPAAMRDRATEAAGLLRTLANPNRLMIVCTLAEGEFSVGQLEERLEIRQPTLSQQLTVLRDSQIVRTRRESKQIFYRLSERKAAALVEALYTIFCTDEAGR
ncbi:sulfite-sensing transcriptional repressor BigR [Geminicoccus roseus]|uniref:sulfite-sensing transcriptional repressor BigR n=1 Tax=Geminicoccus roseus TaxID=404900 RepID=UPI00040F2680|nr:sulfite-sensing transcriptional repressor BigR [Geminicoccus roseus]